MTCQHFFTRSLEFPFRFYCTKCCRFRIDIREHEAAILARATTKRDQDERDARRWRALVWLAAMRGSGFEAAMREAIAEADKAP